jgi:hypothetical protein
MIKNIPQSLLPEAVSEDINCHLDRIFVCEKADTNTEELYDMHRLVQLISPKLAEDGRLVC